MNVSSDLEKRLKELLYVFLEENSKLNLSALRTEDACWHGNILDSLAFLELIDRQIIPSPKTIIDVGTGGGFPLLALAMALPDATCTGLDSTNKKIAAIGRMTERLALQNVRLIADRAEIIGRKPEHREQYDVVTSRAVAPLSTLLELTVPLAQTDGHIVLWKSLHIDEELKQSTSAQKILGCSLAHSHRYDLGGDWGERQLLVYRKDTPTPAQYPRGIGEAKAKPL